MKFVLVFLFILGASFSSFAGIDQLTDGISKQLVNEIALGNVAGARIVRKFAYIPEVDSDTGERDLWEFGSVDLGDVNYTYPLDGTATIDTVVSSSASDTMSLTVEGLTADGTYTTQIASLSGTAPVSLTTPLWRCYRAYNNSSATSPTRGVGLNGIAYVYESSSVTAGVPDDDSKVKAIINDGNNQTLMSMYTTSKDEYAVFYAGSIKLIKRGTAGMITKFYMREYGKVMRLVDVGSLNATGTSYGDVAEPKLIVIPPLTDILLTVDSDTNNVGASVAYTLILFDKNIWPIK